MSKMSFDEEIKWYEQFEDKKFKKHSIPGVKYEVYFLDRNNDVLIKPIVENLLLSFEIKKCKLNTIYHLYNSGNLPFFFKEKSQNYATNP